MLYVRKKKTGKSRKIWLLAMQHRNKSFYFYFLFCRRAEIESRRKAEEVERKRQEEEDRKAALALQVLSVIFKHTRDGCTSAFARWQTGPAVRRALRRKRLFDPIYLSQHNTLRLSFKVSTCSWIAIHELQSMLWKSLGQLLHDIKHLTLMYALRFEIT